MKPVEVEFKGGRTVVFKRLKRLHKQKLPRKLKKFQFKKGSKRLKFCLAKARKVLRKKGWRF